MSGEKTNNTIQAFWVALGSFAAFLVSLISAMILSRYFDKTDYGTYRQVLYIYTTLLTVFTLGLPKAYAYFLPRVEDIYAKSLIGKITRIFYILGSILSILLFVFSSQIALVLKNPDLALALRIFSPVPFFMLPTMGIEVIYATYQKNKYIALYNLITKSLILLCVALPVIFFKGTYKEAIAGFVIASFISFILATYMKSWCVKGKGNSTVNIQNRDIFKFSLPLMMASVWGMLINSTDNFFISRYFGTEVFAEFANGSLQLPFVGMIIGACSTVLMPLFSKKVHENANPQKDILPIWISSFEKTIKITYPLVFFFLFFATEIMTLLYGAKYSDSGTYFSIMLFVNFFTVISYFPILIAIGEVKFYRNIHMWWAVSIIALESMAIVVFNSPYAVTVISVACRITVIMIMLKHIAKYFQIRLIELIPLRLVSKLFILSLAIISVIKLGITYVFPYANDLLIITASSVLYLVAYIYMAALFNIDYTFLMNILSQKLKKIWLKI